MGDVELRQTFSRVEASNSNWSGNSWRIVSNNRKPLLVSVAQPHSICKYFRPGAEVTSERNGTLAHVVYVNFAKRQTSLLGRAQRQYFFFFENWVSTKYNFCCG